MLGLALVATPVDAFGVSGGRIDFGDVDRGETATATFVVRGDAATDTMVTLTTENDPTGALTVSPTNTTVPAGGAVTIIVTLTTPADAIPGRHQPGVMVAETTTPGGNVASGAVRVPALYVVQAVDVAVAQFAGDKVQVRIVNGHAEARTIDLSAASSTKALEHGPAPTAVAGGASWLVEWTPVWANVTNGTHTIQVTGTATGGDAPEAFDALLRLTVAGNDRSFAAPAPVPAPSGGGSGGVGSGGASPAPTPEPQPAAPDGINNGGGGGTPTPPAASLVDLLFGEGTSRRTAPSGDGLFSDTGAPPRKEDTSTTPLGPWAVSSVLAMAALAAAASGLRRGFKNHGGKRPPSRGA